MSIMTAIAFNDYNIHKVKLLQSQWKQLEVNNPKAFLILRYPNNDFGEIATPLI